MTSSALNAVNEYLMLKALVENAAAVAAVKGKGEGGVERRGEESRPSAAPCLRSRASLNQRVDFKLFLQLEHAIKNK